MPLDKSGKFHSNVGRAMGADKNAMPEPKPKAARPAAPAPMGGGDESGAGEHLQAFQDRMGGGKAMLVHHDGINLQSHQIGEDGEVEGPHDHDNLEALKQHMDQFLDEEGAESSAGLGGLDGDGY